MNKIEEIEFDDLVESIYVEFDLDFEDIEHTKIRIFDTDEDCLLVQVMYKGLLCMKFLTPDGDYHSKDDDNFYGVEVGECVFYNQLSLFENVFKRFRLSREYNIKLYSDKYVNGEYYTLSLSKTIDGQELTKDISFTYKKGSIETYSNHTSDCCLFTLNSN